jgi:hypothetical protein
VEFEQRGKERSVYGSELLKRLSGDLQSRFDRGLSERNLEQMRQFYLQWENPQTLSAASTAGISPKISHMPSAKLSLGDVPLFSPIDGPTASGNLVVDRTDNAQMLELARAIPEQWTCSPVRSAGSKASVCKMSRSRVPWSKSVEVGIFPSIFDKRMNDSPVECQGGYGRKPRLSSRR